MIEFFSASIISLSVVMIVLLCAHKILLQQLGAQVTYPLWLLVPLAVLMSFLPSPDVLSVSLVMDNMLVSNLKQVAAASVSTSDILLFVWVLGFIILTSVLALAHVKHYASLKDTLKPHYVEHLPKAGNKTLPVFTSAQVTSPMLSGFWTTKLILPQGFATQYSTTQQKLILAHENYHYGRFDIYWNYFAMLLLLVFWFHPLAWLAYFRFRQDQELSCDQAVLVNQPITVRQQYARALLQTIERQHLHIAYLSFGKSGDNRMLKERIQTLKKAKSASPKLATALIVLGSLVLASSIQAKSTESLAPLSGMTQEVKDKQALTAPIVRIAPNYPLEASQDGVEGYVVLNFTVTPQGKVKEIEVVESSPEGVFDDAATKALAKWRYSPNKSETTNATIQLDFKLSE
jgi:TonB family protein